MEGISEENDFKLQLHQEELARLAKEEGDTLLRGVAYTDEDGTVMEWDYEKKAYFPKIDTQFIAQYQISYGETTSQQAGQKLTDKGKNSLANDYWRDYCNVCSQQQPALSGLDQEDELDEQKRNCKRKPKDTSAQCSNWYEADHESIKQVYITGLPPDTTKEELMKIMSKCGVIEVDTVTNMPKLKLYRDKDGNVKGDGICTYARSESVMLAVEMLAGVDVRGHKLSIERASFHLKGKYDQSKKRKTLSNKMKHKYRDTHKIFFDLRPEEDVTLQQSKHDHVVIFKNMFDPNELKRNPALIIDLRTNIRDECLKFGHIEKIYLFEDSKEGVASITFKISTEAETCVASLHERFAEKGILVEMCSDKTTKYDETEKDLSRTFRM